MDIRIYRTYRFIDKDPAIDAVRTIVQDEHLNNHQVHNLSGVADTTLAAWFTGGTRNPKNSSITAVTSALGYVRRDRLNKDGTVVVRYVKARTLDYDAEKDHAIDWIKNHPPVRRPKKRTNGHS